MDKLVTNTVVTMCKNSKPNLYLPGKWKDLFFLLSKYPMVPTAVPGLFDGVFSLDHFSYGFVENQEVNVLLLGITLPRQRTAKVVIKVALGFVKPRLPLLACLSWLFLLPGEFSFSLPHSTSLTPTSSSSLLLQSQLKTTAFQQLKR